MTRAVAYYRVSTAKQGASGLGLDAQRKAVEGLCAERGWEIIAPPFEEIESGKNNDRPQLAAALERCKITGAILVVAKLDRLSRNVAFLAALQDSGAKFIAADMPEANELTVHIMAAVAQAERKAISKRTKEALAAVKARGAWQKADGTPYKSGQRLGNPNGAAALRRAGDASPLGVAAAKAKANEHAQRLRGTVDSLRAEGHTSLGSIATALNERKIVTPRGGQWHASSVRNLLNRLLAS
jgi:DNA invertase Pin-like site-specific DNA recombinase